MPPYLIFLVFFLVVVVIPWFIWVGTETSKRKLTIVRAMRAVSILILLLIGILFVIISISLINDARGTDNGGDASAYFVFGIVAAFIGSLSCLAALGLGAKFILSRPLRK